MNILARTASATIAAASDFMGISASHALEIARVTDGASLTLIEQTTKNLTTAYQYRCNPLSYPRFIFDTALNLAFLFGASVSSPFYS